MKAATKAAQKASIPAAIAAQAVIAAAEKYIARRDRYEHPDGTFDNAKRWYPYDSEERDCCGYIRSPSRSYPFSILVHCRTAAHVAALRDVDEKEMKRIVRELEKEYEIDEEALM